MKIKVSMTCCMTLKTMIMVTRTKLLFVADIHTNACTYIIYNESNYACRTQFLWFSLSSFIHTNNIQTWWRFYSCIIAYVNSQWWYCADRSYAFLNMGGVRSRKYCASRSDMTTTWGLRREVVLRINLSRASIEAWRMLWHLSSNGSRVWLRNWVKGYMSAESSRAVKGHQTPALFKLS